MIGLVMIVKNEEAVIERALLSAKPFISTYVIVDTGSTDRTKEIIAATMADVSGIIVDRPWVNFGVNRSEALALCDDHMDWAIMIDADDTLAGTVPPATIWTPNIDAFIMSIRHGPIIHNRVQIFRTRIGWRYEGAVHEYPDCGRETVIATLPPETYMQTRCEGARSKDPQKYLKDALLLETDLATKVTHRTLFYLAQSYRDAGIPDMAIKNYQRYIDLSGGWNQERYMAMVNILGLTKDIEARLALTWRAIDLCPDRVEAPYTFLHQHRLAGHPLTQQCYAIAQAVANRKIHRNFLFANPALYDWGMDDELAVVGYWTGHYRYAYEAAMRCAMTAPEPHMRENALKNAKFAFDKLPA
jgi:glycosyltransferase involved in cell wall biosynthesis